MSIFSIIKKTLPNMLDACSYVLNVTEFWKTVPNHTFIFITATQGVLHIQR